MSSFWVCVGVQSAACNSAVVGGRAAGVDYICSSSSSSHNKAASRLRLRLSSARGSPSTLSAVLRRSRCLSKSVRLAALGQLLHQEDWQLAMRMYKSIQEEPWYKMHVHLHAHVVALLVKFQELNQATSLMSGLEQKLSPRELATLYSCMIKHYGRYGLKDEMFSTCFLLHGLPLPSAVSQGSRAVLHAVASMDLPNESEEILAEMQREGYNPSKDDYKALLASYGRCRFFDNMERIAKKLEDLEKLTDTATWNMIFTAYAVSQEHDKLGIWLAKMLVTEVCLSVCSLNILVHACPVLNYLASMASGGGSLCSDTVLDMLRMHNASSGEIQTVKFLLEVCVLPEIAVWSSYWCLDLHSLRSGAAYIVFFSWLKEASCKLGSGVLPTEVIIVTGWGKHSQLRGKSTVKLMILSLLASMESPFRLDSQNRGRLLAKGLAVKHWLNQYLCKTMTDDC